MTTYNPDCKYCRQIDISSLALLEAIIGGIIGYQSHSILRMIIFVLLAQPVVFLARLVINHTLPMSHHWFMKKYGEEN